jgi:hypothetical protein
MWLKSQFPEVKVLAMDPYARSRQHNLHAFQEIKQATGADVVTSISVLNVIRSPHARTLHYLTLLDACRPGGVVMMKVWAGAWPRRGSGIGGKFPQKLTNSLCSASHLALTTMNLTNPLHPSHIKSSTKIEEFFRLINGQANLFFVSEAEEVFGEGNVFADNNKNLIVAFPL